MKRRSFLNRPTFSKVYAPKIRRRTNNTFYNRTPAGLGKTRRYRIRRWRTYLCKHTNNIDQFALRVIGLTVGRVHTVDISSSCGQGRRELYAGAFYFKKDDGRLLYNT